MCFVVLQCMTYIMSFSRFSSVLSLCAPAFSSRVPDFFRIMNRSTYSEKSCLLDLPNDILVDRIFMYLEAHEVLRLRRVCKLLYHLTHHAAIWKRLLRLSNLPIPPLPPTRRHCLKNLGTFETEQLMTRAISLERNWYWCNPGLLDAWKFNAFHRVVQMVLLPGSQYMVASVCDTGGSEWSIVVFAMDGRYGVVPIAKTLTRTKAVNLQAKYLTVNGAAGITIAYIRRAWRHRDDAKKGIDISDYSCEHEVDPPYPVKYECHALHVPLAELEAMCDPRSVPGSKEFLDHAASLPPPFRHLCLVRSTRHLGKLCLEEIQGSPTLCIHRHPNSILFKPLNGRPVSTMNILPHAEFPRRPTHVTGFCLLPNQNQLLVLREIDVSQRRSKWPVTSLEFHTMPPYATAEPLEVNRTPEVFTFLFEDRYTDVTITTQAIPNWFGEDESEESPGAKYAFEKAPFKARPINIFMRAIAPEEGLVRITFYPRYDDGWLPPTPEQRSFSTSQFRLDEPPPSRNFSYGFTHASPVRFISAPSNSQYRVLSGPYRVLVYTVPWNTITTSPKIQKFYRYYDCEMFADEPEDFVEGVERKPIRHIPMNHTFPPGTTAMTWDETIGRVVYTAENTTEVHVLDFAKSPKQDLYGRKFPLAVEQDHDINPDSVWNATGSDTTEDKMKILPDRDGGFERETSRHINSA